MARGVPLFGSAAAWPVRWRRAPLGIALVWLTTGLGACGEPKRRPVSSDGWGPTNDMLGAAPVATSTPPPAPRATAIPVSDRVPWARADELDALVVVSGRGPSEHLSGRYERRVRVNEAAAGYTDLVPHRELPVGALVAQSHHPPGSDAVVSWYVMEKLEGSWRFLVLDPERRVAATQDLEPCRRCHAEAPGDHLFGPVPTAQDSAP